MGGRAEYLSVFNAALQYLASRLLIKRCLSGRTMESNFIFNKWTTRSSNLRCASLINVDINLDVNLDVNPLALLNTSQIRQWDANKIKGGEPIV